MSLVNDLHPALNGSSENIRALSIIKIDDDKIITYAESIVKRAKWKSKAISAENLKDNRTKGQLSEPSLRKIKRHIYAWAYAILEHNKDLKYYEQNQRTHLVMLTLTLSAYTDKNDKELKRELFGRMIEKLKTMFHVEYYFIRYEAQSNGRLHAHIIIDKYIDKTEVQLAWNKIQNRLKLIDEFEKIYKHRNPPSTHIKEITASTQTINYLLKYVLKKEEYRSIEGHLYGMSDKLREIETSTYILDYEASTFVQACMDHPQSQIYYGDFFTVIYLNKTIYSEFMPLSLSLKQHNHYVSVYNYLYMPKLQYDFGILSAIGRKKYALIVSKADALTEQLQRPLVPTVCQLSLFKDAISYHDAVVSFFQSHDY